MPLWGGVSLFSAILAGVAVAGTNAFVPSDHAWGTTGVMLVAGAALCLFGVVDDCRGLTSRQKLLLQVAALLLLIGLGYRIERIDLFGHSMALGWLGYPVTVVWLLACINAFNLLDGGDGLAAAVGLTASLLIAIVALAMGHREVGVLAVVLAGAAAGFLVHNHPPARIFLGDSGSMVIGFVVGILSVEAATTPQGGAVVVFPAVLMCLPVFDGLLALLRRGLSGRPFDEPDRQHIHHRLVERGLNPWQVLGVIVGLFIVTGTAAAAAILSGYRAIGWTAAATLVIWMARTRWFGHHEWELAVEAFRPWFARPWIRHGSRTGLAKEKEEPPRRRAA